MTKNSRKAEISEEDNRLIGGVTTKLAAQGLGYDRIETLDNLGFSHPEKGYGIVVGAVLLRFEKEFEQVREGMPRGYSRREAWPVSYTHIGRPIYVRWIEISENKRDIMAKRVLVKDTIRSLKLEIKEQKEASEGSHPYVDSYYKIRLENMSVGLFIVNPQQSSHPRFI